MPSLRKVLHICLLFHGSISSIKCPTTPRPRPPPEHWLAPLHCPPGAAAAWRAGASAALLRALQAGRVRVAASVALFVEYEATCTRAEHLLAAGLTLAEVTDFLDALAALVEPTCIDPAVSAQVRLLKHKPQRGSSCSTPGEGVGGCTNRSSPQSRGWHAARFQIGGGVRIGL
jgi:hypothetical protein